MSWNYRVLKHTADGNSEAFYSVHEVFYEPNSDGTKKHSWTENTVGPHGVSQADFIHGLRLFLAAFSKPILVVDGDTLLGEEEWDDAR